MKVAGVIWLVIVAAAGVFLLLRLHDGLEFQSDLLALLPQEDRDPGVQYAKLKAGTLLGQRIILLVGDKDRADARSAGAELAAALTGSDIASSVTFVLPPDGLRRLAGIFFPYREGLLTAADRARLEEGRGQEIVARALANVYGPAGVADAALLRRDPFFLLPSFLAALPTPLPRLAVDEGVLSVEDGAKTYVLVAAQLRGDTFSLAAQDHIVEVLGAAEQKLRSRLPGVEVLRFGTVFYAHAGASAAVAETSAISILSLVGTVVLVLAVFRALRPLWLTALAIGIGVVCAFAVSLWIFGNLHVAALLFGVSLIGISLDYCLQYLSARFDATANTPWRRLYRVLPGISLGIATTLIGYVTLLIAPFPGLRQVAVFSAVGLVASFMTVLLWLPALDSTRPLRHGRRLLAAADWLWSFWGEKRYRLPRVAVLGIALALAVIGGSAFAVDDDVHRLQTISQDLKRQEEALRRLTGLSAATEFLLLRAADGEVALQTEEMLLARLGEAKREGALAGYSALAQVVPSIARQRADAALVRDKLIRPFLPDYYAQLGMPPGAMIEESEERFLVPADIPEDSPLSALRQLEIAEGPGGAMHLVFLSGVSDRGEVKRLAESVPGVSLIDPAGDVTRLLGEYRRRAVLLLGLSLLFMMPVVIWRYGWRGSLRVLMPPTAAVLLAPLLVALAGIPFTFFGAMALVLVLSIGFDYAVFCKETDPVQRPVTMLGVWLAMVTTLLSFGLLAFSRVFAVQAFGATLLVGTLLAFLAAPLTGDSTTVRTRMAGESSSPKRAWPRSLAKRLVAMLLLAFSACSATTPEPAAYIAPELRFALPSPRELGRSVDAVQLVTAHYRGDVQMFEAHLSVSPERLTLIGLDPFGRRALTLTMTDAGMTVDKASWLPQGLRPENILADVAIVYWPEDAVRRGLARTDAVLTSDGRGRSIIAGGREVVRVNYGPRHGDSWAGAVHYRNSAFGYELDLRSAVEAP